MQLRYFLPPYDLLKHVGNHDNQVCNTKNKDSITMLTLDEIAKQDNIGQSATVCLEASSRPNLLPTGSLYSVNKQNSGTLDPLPLGPNNR